MMEHRPRDEHLQLSSDTHASIETLLKELQEKKKTILTRSKTWKNETTFKWAIPNSPFLLPCSPRPKD